MSTELKTSHFADWPNSATTTALLFADEAALLRALDVVFVNGADMVRPFFENRRPDVLAAGAFPCVISLPDGLCIEWVVRERPGPRRDEVLS